MVLGSVLVLDIHYTTQSAHNLTYSSYYRIEHRAVSVIRTCKHDCYCKILSVTGP